MTSVFVSHPADKLAMYYGAKATAALESIANVRFNAEPRDLTTPELIDAARGCDALIAYRATPGPEALFRSLPELAAFIRCAIDISSVDVGAASRHGVLVTQASPGFVPAVAEWIVAAMIALARGMVGHAEAYHRGELPQPLMGRELRGSTLGIVGFGRIARQLRALAFGFDMRVLATDPNPIDTGLSVRQLPLAELLRESDFVVCLAAATPQTTDLFDAAAFGAIRPGAYFVNAARGQLVDDAALLAALESGRLAGCALDVGTAPDQMPAPALARHPRVIATPHVGGLTQPAIEHQALETVAQLKSLIDGAMPPGAVNPAHATRWKRWAGAQASVVVASSLVQTTSTPTSSTS